MAWYDRTPHSEQRRSHNQRTAISAISAGRRAVIWALAGHLSSPGMAYWMVACSVYLYIAILGATVRICRDAGHARLAPASSSARAARVAGSR
jgi:hypothetical protein